MPKTRVKSAEKMTFANYQSELPNFRIRAGIWHFKSLVGSVLGLEKISLLLCCHCGLIRFAYEWRGFIALVHFIHTTSSSPGTNVG